MIKRFKKTVIFTLIGIILVTVLNALSSMGIHFIPYLYNDYSFLEYFFTGVFYGVIVFVFLYILGVEKSYYRIPILYLGFSILILSINYFDGFELLFHLNFSFSRVSYLIYQSLKQTSLLSHIIADTIAFNGVFFIYQMCLFYFTEKIYKKHFL